MDDLRGRLAAVLGGEVPLEQALERWQRLVDAMATVHANTPRDAATRLETLCLLSDADLPIHVARSQVASALHLVVQISRFVDGSRRVTEIAECLELDSSGNYAWSPLFRFEPDGVDDDGLILGNLVPTGLKPSFMAEPKQQGLKGSITKCRRLFEVE